MSKKTTILAFVAVAMFMSWPALTRNLSLPSPVNWFPGGTARGTVDMNDQVINDNGGDDKIRFDDAISVYHAGSVLVFETHGSNNKSYKTLVIDGWLVTQSDEDTIADSGDGNPATHTLTPEDSYVELTCNDAHTCDITMGEAGLWEGQVLRITNVSANVCDFADTGGVSELAGAFAMGQYDFLELMYDGTTWIETGRSNN